MAAPLRKFAEPLMRESVSDMDMSIEAIQHLLGLAEQIKRTPARFSKSLAGRYLTLLFEKPSLRTRLTFELAIKQLGGDAVTERRSHRRTRALKDVARNLDRWTNGIVARVFSQSTIDELAQWSSVPVINALSDRLSSLPGAGRHVDAAGTFRRFEGLKLAFVGDGNNVAHSLMLTAGRLGMNVAHRHAGKAMSRMPRSSRRPPRVRRSITVTNDPAEAVTARTPSTPTSGPAWGRSRSGRAPARFRALSGE